MIAQTNAANDVANHLLVRVPVNGGEEVGEFYEPIPGYVIFSASGSPRGPTKISPRAIAKLKPLAIFQLLAPNMPIPQPLQEAAGRADALEVGITSSAES